MSNDRNTLISNFQFVNTAALMLVNDYRCSGMSSDDRKKVVLVDQTGASKYGFSTISDIRIEGDRWITISAYDEEEQANFTVTNDLFDAYLDNAEAEINNARS